VLYWGCIGLGPELHRAMGQTDKGTLWSKQRLCNASDAPFDKV